MVGALPSVWRRLGLAAIVLTAALIQTRGVSLDLPYAPSVDESFFVQPAARMAQRGDLNPHWFGHPGSTTIYPLAALYRLRGGDPIAQRPGPYYLFARGLSIACALLGLLLLYLAARRWFDDSTALVATWLTATSVPLAALCRIARTDGASLLAAALLMHRAAVAFETPSGRNLILLGVCLGLAVATKYYFAVFGLLLVVIGVRALRRSPRPSVELRHLLAAASVALAVFALFTPYFFLDFAATWQSLRAEAAPHATHSQSSLLATLWFYTAIAPRELLGLLPAALALAGTVLVLRSRRAQLLPPLATAVVFVLAISAMRLTWTRWLIPIVPILSALAAHALMGLARLARGSVAVGVLAVLLSLGAAAQGWPQLAAERYPSTRWLARHWVFANLPSGTHLAQESDGASWMAGDSTDTTVMEARSADKQLTVEVTFTSLADDGRTLEHHRCRGIEYLLINVPEARRRMSDRPGDPYSAFYQRLDRDARLVFQAQRPGSGPFIKIYDIRAVACP